jgi:hypothetical protein
VVVVVGAPVTAVLPRPAARQCRPLSNRSLVVVLLLLLPLLLLLLPLLLLHRPVGQCVVDAAAGCLSSSALHLARRHE